MLILLPRGVGVGSFPSPSSWLTPGPLQKSGCFQGKVKLTEVFRFHFFGSVCFVGNGEGGVRSSFRGRLGIAGSLVTGPGNGVLRPSFRGMCSLHHVAFLRSPPGPRRGGRRHGNSGPGCLGRPGPQHACRGACRVWECWRRRSRGSWGECRTRSAWETLLLVLTFAGSRAVQS